MDYEAEIEALGGTIYGGHVFKYFSEYKTWGQAKIACESMGGHLATSTSAEKNAFLAGLTTEIVWLGGTDEAQEGTWQWVTGEEWSYTNWLSGQPDNSGSAEHYLELNRDSTGYWNDVSATTTWGYICEWDSLEAAYYALNDYAFYNGHTFKCFTEYKTWTEAKAACEALGGHLATITSQEKSDFIDSIRCLVDNGTLILYHIWIGGYIENHELKWITSEVSDYLNFSYPYFSLSQAEDSFLMISYANYSGAGDSVKWEIETTDRNSKWDSYICEWDYDMRTPEPTEDPTEDPTEEPTVGFVIENVRIQFKRGTSSVLAEVNPVLLAGELCLETDTGRFKFGDGTTAWGSLGYAEAGIPTTAHDNRICIMKNGVWTDMSTLAAESEPVIEDYTPTDYGR